MADTEQLEANAGTTEGTTEGQGTAGAGDSANQEVSYEVDGEKVPVSKIKEWKSGNLMQADYTKKTQELSEQRKQLEPYLQAHQWSQQNPDKWGQVQAIINEGQNQSYVDPEVQKMNVQNQQLKAQLTNLQLRTMMNEVKQDPKYGGVFNDPDTENMLLEKMLARTDVNSNPNVHKESAEKLFEFINKGRAKAILEGEDKIKKEIQGRPSAGKGTMSLPAKFDPSKASPKELRQAAVDMLS